MPGRSFLSRLTGSFATPAAENPTVAMIEAAYRHHGLDARYVNCEVAPERLGDAVRGAAAMGWVGFNCSIPHKVAVIEHLDGLGESAALIGAANCAVRRDGRWIGENTDGQGVIESRGTVAGAAGRAGPLCGAGGAAGAVAVMAARGAPGTPRLFNEVPGRGRELVAPEGAQVPAELVVWDGTHRVAEGTDIVVNATSIGLF